MTDRLLITVCLGCLGALIGFAICSRMKRRAEYFADLDGFLSVFSDSLAFTLDTVPGIMKNYATHTRLLQKQLEACADAINSGEKANLPSGSLSREEYTFVSRLLCDLGSRSVPSERSAVANYRQRLDGYAVKAKNSYERSGKVAVKLGFLAGMLTAVLCW